MKKQRLSSLLLALSIMCSFTACGKKEAESTDKNGTDADTPVQNVTIRFLNFKPEIAGAFDEVSRAYKEETGNTLIVETAANNTYEQTLSAKMSTDEAPTIFQINGPRGYANWRDYCLDLTDTEIYSHLIDHDAVVKSDGKVYGIPSTIEGYGIIYNNAIMEKYFTLESKNTDFVSMEEINSFEELKMLTEDMQANKDALGIKGVFASTSLKSGDDWRWTTHLANIALENEFDRNDIDLTGSIPEIKFDYSDNFKNIFDLYLNNSVTDRKMLGTKITDESMAEFAMGECAMVQNGSWAWSQINGIQGNTVKEEDIRMLPIYMGLEEEDKQGLCIGTENFLCINSKAKPEEQQTAKDFLFWLYSSETGKDLAVNSLGFIAPYDTFTEEERPDDPLSREVLRWMDKEDIHNIPWSFTVFPSQTFKDDVGAALLQYAQESRDWDYVRDKVISSWKTESSMS